MRTIGIKSVPLIPSLSNLFNGYQCVVHYSRFGTKFGSGEGGVPGHDPERRRVVLDGTRVSPGD